MRNKLKGYTLVELVVVMTAVAILSTAAVPSFRRTLERSKVDQAAANLRSIWSAQQLFWLEHREYATSMDQLESLRLVDPIVVSTHGDYQYTVQSATHDAFTVRADRRASGRFSGSLSIDENGIVTGGIRSPDAPPILPSFK